MEKILIVDDEESIRSSLRDIFEDEGERCLLAASAEDGLKVLKNEHKKIQVVLLDIWMPGMDGMEMLERIKKMYPKVYVIMMSGHGTIETAVKATKRGAYDFIEKPLSLEKVVITVSHALKAYQLEAENEVLKSISSGKSSEIIGESKRIIQLKEQIKMAAPSDGWVLIHGENGTGKELVANQIHSLSLRKDKPFVEMNCAAIPEELIESELFGHEKGSFTGAVAKKEGKFLKANGGTLFLDEIGDMSLKTQAKILRVLQEQRFERVGGNETVSVDVRIIAASNKLLTEEIESGNFREDLYYRLNVIPIDVPPLRDRRTDIPLLVNHFIEQYAKASNYNLKRLSEKAMGTLENYHWPGNIRELKNIVERMMIMVPGDEIGETHIPHAVRSSLTSSLSVSDFPDTMRDAKEQFEKAFLERKLEDNSWNISRTAESIQLERSNLHKKIKQLDIHIPKD